MVPIVQQGGSNCSTRWFQFSDKVVPIVRQNLAIRAIGTTFLGKQDHFRIKQRGPNSQNKWSQFSDGSNSPTYSTSEIQDPRNSTTEKSNLPHDEQ